MRENKAKQNLYLCWEVMASWNKGKPTDFCEAQIPNLLPQKFKIPNSKNAHCQKEKQTGEISLNFSGWDVAPEPFGLHCPAREFPQIPNFSFSLFWRSHCHWDILAGTDIFSVFLNSIFISFHASIPRPILLILLKGKHFFQDTDLSQLSMVTAGICDYLMGLADYEKACFTVGVLRKEKWAGGCLDLR